MATSLRVDDELDDRIRKLAALRDRSPNWIIRDALRQYVDREEARESFKREALDSWTAYRETGLHLTSDEVDGWLDSWGTEGDAKTPECHE